jgi:hypothetical protein
MTACNEIQDIAALSHQAFVIRYSHVRDSDDRVALLRAPQRLPDHICILDAHRALAIGNASSKASVSLVRSLKSVPLLST